MSQASDQDTQNLRATLSDIGQRLPAYAKLSHRLVAEGLMSSAQQGQLLGGLGYGSSPLSRIPRFIPVLGQISRVLSMIGAVNYALTQMQPDVADAHLAAVGLDRSQVEADLRVSKNLARQAAEAGSKHASKAVEDGARIAGRLAGKGLRSFRSWQERTASSQSSSDRSETGSSSN